VAGSDAGVFVTDQDAAVITRIDPATNRVAARIPIPAYGAIAVGAGAAWAADAQANVVDRIDPHASG
jgi:streptogramin lyase